MQKQENAPRPSEAPCSSFLAASPAGSSPGRAARIGARTATAWWLLGSALVLAACGGDRTSTVEPPMPVDAHFEPDGGPDVEPLLDAGPARDAGAPLDAGAPVDAGAPFDAGIAADAGLPADAGADAGAPPREEPTWRTYGFGLHDVRATYSCGPEAWFAGGFGGSWPVSRLEGDSVSLVFAEVFDDVVVSDLFGRGCDDVWAVGTHGATMHGVVAHYDGVTWSEVEVPALGDRRPVSVTGNSSHLWITGNQPGSTVFLFEHDGAAWTERAVPERAQQRLLGATDGGALFMASSVVVGAVAVHRLEDGAATVIELPTPSSQIVASAVVAGALWVGLDRGAGIFRIDEDGWERFTTADDPTAIAAAEGGGVVVTGSEGSVAFLGSTWPDPVALPEGSDRGWSVWMHEGRLHVGARHDGNGVVYALEAPFDAGAWRTVDRDFGSRGTMGARRNGDLTRADGQIFFTAHNLHVFDLAGPGSAGFDTDVLPFDRGSSAVDHWVLSDGTRVVVDQRATLVREPGGAWTEILDGVHGVSAVWGDASDRLYFSLYDSDRRGRLIEGPLGALSDAAPVSLGDVPYLAGHAVGDEVFAAGRGSVMVRRGGAWAPLADPVVEAASETGSWHDVHGSTESLWIVGSRILERTPAGWEEHPLPPGAVVVERVFVEAPGEVWVAGPGGVHRWDGIGWEALELPLGLTPSSINGIASGGGRLFIATRSAVWSHRLDRAEHD